jgi:ribosomal protein S25
MSSERRLKTAALIESRGIQGITVAELCQIHRWHHGIASGVLSHLHEEGRLARLEQKRDTYRIYVTPAHVDGRITEKYGRRRR